MKKPTKLPKQIFVFWRGDPPERYLSAQETPLGIEDGTQVGVYRLDAVKEQKVTEELV